MRVGFPPSLNEKLRIQSTGGAVYLRAESAFPQTRLQLQDVESGEILLLDVTATAGKGKLEPVRVVYSGEVSTQRDSQSVRRSGQAAGRQPMPYRKAWTAKRKPVIRRRYRSY